MGLNDIQLTGTSLADLYPQSLVVFDTPAGQSQDAGTSIAITGGKTAAVRDGAAKTGSTDVAEPPRPIAAEAGSGPEWRFLGNNQKRVLVVVDYPGMAYLPDEELAFLTKMLTACKLGLGDVAIVNAAGYGDRTSGDYLKYFRSAQVVLFGKDPEAFGLPMSFPVFQVQSFAGVDFLSAPGLTGMMDDKEQKSSLWTCLKRLFNL